MRSGRGGKRRQKEFETEFAALRRDYEADRQEAMLVRLKKMERRGLFPPERHQEYHILIGQVYYELADLNNAFLHMRAAWEDVNAPLKMRLAMLSDYLMYLHYAAHVSDAEMRAAHEEYARLMGEIPQFRHEKRSRTKLRIGYLSPNLTDHIVLNFAVQLFSRYNKERFEIFLYDVGGQKSEVTEWIAAMADHYCDLTGRSTQEAARRIYADEIDILFDLAGHSVGGLTLQIAAYKPAPVQLSGIGYFDTTGLPAMDYFLGDPICDPPETDALFFERVLRLPQTHLCFTPSERFAAYEHLRRVPHDPVVFGSFNNFAKITDEMLRLWGEILERVPDAQLVLKNVNPHKDVLARMRQRAKRAGIDPARLDLRVGSHEYLRDYLDVDIILDTYPYQGGGTTCEALFMGLPVVTLYGTRHGARFGASILQNAGLGELVADSPAAYVERAVLLAEDPELLSALHASVQRMMRASPMMDGAGYVRDMEAAYEMIWERYLYEEA